MSFCQFCGARLGEPAAAHLLPPSPPPPPPPLNPPTPPQADQADFGPAASGWSAGPPTEEFGATPAETPAAARRQESVNPPRAAVAGAPRLVVIAQDGTPGREYRLEHDQTDIGREEGAIRLPQDPYVSPRHARISRRDGRYTLRDLDSLNRVYLRLRQTETLRNGDLVLIGLEVLRFEAVSDAERVLGPAAESGTKVFGSPAAPRYARLCQRTVEGVTRNVCYLSGDEIVIGRESGDIVFTSDPFMSRRHAAISRNPAENVFMLRDLRSSNGTYLAIRGEVELKTGDYLRVGQHLFRFDLDPAR